MYKKFWLLGSNLEKCAVHGNLGLSGILIRQCSKSSDPGYGNQLGGFEYREEIEPFRSRWRKPFYEREWFWKSKFQLFGDRGFPADNVRYNPYNRKFFSFNRWWGQHKKDRLIFTQQFIQERLDILGCDLASAHFVVFRGGAVKFCNHSEWIRDDKKSQTEYDENLPNCYKPDYMLEAIDFSGTPILYEGLQNIKNLSKLKWLSFSNCRFFDNFCLDKVAGEYGENLEYLDLSYTKITYHALNAIYKFRRLTTLILDDLSDDPQFYIMCAELRKNFPQLKIEGIPEEFLTAELDDSKIKESIKQ